MSCFLFSLLSLSCSGPPDEELPSLQYVTTARQFGPVGYRDPVGAVSPDGTRLAYAVQRHLWVTRVEGGPPNELSYGDYRIRYLTWLPDSRHVAVYEQGGRRWWLHDTRDHTRKPLWADVDSLRGTDGSGNAVAGPVSRVLQLAWSPNGESVAGVVPERDGATLWIVSDDGREAQVHRSDARLSFPTWTGAGDGLACVVDTEDHPRMASPCTDASNAADGPEAYGRIAFAAGGRLLYHAVPNERGVLDLWSRDLATGTRRRLTGFSRDAYAPTVATGDVVLFKTQIYRTHVAGVLADGGTTTALAGFTSETPSWDPTGRYIGLTYGNWRRVVDDVGYPDIDQDVGIIAVDWETTATEPARIVEASESEDQSMFWSPNGKWIAFHSHQQLSDDLWIQPADGSAPIRRITHLGRGAEAGWPRWSPDGRWIVFPALKLVDGARRKVLYLAGVDQNTGQVTQPEEVIPLLDFAGDARAADWSPDSERLVVQGFEEPDQHTLYTVRRTGGRLQRVHAFVSEHRISGIGVSPDWRWIAFVQPASDGYFQIFRVPISGGTPEQLTFDPVNKTQPSYSPDGGRLAFTAWTYEAQFWLLKRE